MTNFIIRRINRQDNKQVATIIRATLAEFDANKPGFASFDPEVDFMFEAYKKPGAAYFVVVSEEGGIFGGGGIGALKGNETYCELQKMYFSPGIRGKGFGKLVLNLCLEEAIKLKYSFMYIETLKTMETALFLYEKFRFEYIQSPLGSTGHTGCDVFMVKKL